MQYRQSAASETRVRGSTYSGTRVRLRQPSTTQCYPVAVYLHAKFDDAEIGPYIARSKIAVSRDMVGAHQNLCGSRDLTTSISGIVDAIHGLATATINLSTKKFESSISIYPLRRHERRYKIAKMRWFRVVGHTSCHWKWRHSIERIRVLFSVPYLIPISCSVSEIGLYIARSKIANLNLPTYIWRLRRGSPHCNFAQTGRIV